jgi:formiminotetrahydrofolate cyclodeaminase
MAYSITTKDGITINNIPDDVLPDSPDLKARVAAIRAGGGAGALEPPAPPTPQAAQPTGLLAGLAESITGRARATPETQALPEWTSMPELNQMSVASFKTALGTLMSNPKETVQILQANFPGVQVRQDAKGNYLMRSSVDQKEYAIPPGFTIGDIPRAIGGLAAFTPAGRAATIPGAIAGSAAPQAAIELSQAGTGGSISPAEIGMAAATGPAGQILQRVAPPVVQAVKQGVQRVTGRAPAPAPAPGAQATSMAPPMAPEAPQAAPLSAAMPEAAPAAAAPGVAAEAAEVGVSDVLNLARKASGFGPGSTSAKAQLVDLAQVNPEARAAAERLGMDLPFDVFSDNPQVRSAVGLTRALVAGEAEAAWEGTVRNAIQRADEVSQQFDAAFIEGRPATGLTSQKIVDNLQQTRETLKADAKTIYDQIDQAVPENAPVELSNLKAYLDGLRTKLGPAGRMTQQEANLAKMLEKGELTYFGFMREKAAVGQALEGGKSPYENMTKGSLKSLYGALAKDQLDNVASLAGEEARRELRAANLLTAKQKALEKRIVGAFGQEIDGSVAQRMQTAISTAAKGDAAVFNRLMKVVPQELQKETLATALASVTAGRAAGRATGAAETVFSPAEFTKVYRGLRANPPVYSQMVKIMGPEWDRASRDLYEISRRIADAQARIPTTGKANQILGEAAIDGLFGRIMSSSMAQRAVTGVTSLVPGGGLVAPDIVQWMSATKGAGVQKASKLFASPEFQEMAIEAATKGSPSAASMRKTATSKAFGAFADSINLPKDVDARVQFLQSAIQANQSSPQDNALPPAQP